MRVMPFIALIGALASFSTPVWSASWETLVLEDLGIIKDFPGTPERTETIYARPGSVTNYGEEVGRGPGAAPRRGIAAIEGEHPAVLFEVEADNIIYTMTVVNFQDALEHSANIILECINIYEAAGDLISNIPARTGSNFPSPYGGAWGREITVDLPANRGRVVGACYFVNGNLYRFDAHILPEHGNMLALDALRFTNALDFRMERAAGGESAVPE